MSGFTRDPKYYGDQLVYEALYSKWRRYHSHCSCNEDWLTAHAEQAGFKVVRKGSGFVALVGKGLTVDVNEERLTANALWEAVTGLEGTQDWFERIVTVDRSPEVEAVRKAENDKYYSELRERSRTAKQASRNNTITPNQISYLRDLANIAEVSVFKKAFKRSVQDTIVKTMGRDESLEKSIERLDKLTASKLIAELTNEKQKTTELLIVSSHTGRKAHLIIDDGRVTFCRNFANVPGVLIRRKNISLENQGCVKCTTQAASAGYEYAIDGTGLKVAIRK